MKPKHKIERITFRPDPAMAARLEKVVLASKRTTTSIINEALEAQIAHAERQLGLRKKAA